ncbi:RNA polymerase sigma factor [Parahaliea mediterranea]|uniref:RNA polymerase sigma factor n=1 Tax=Parahaliea mediterranea TaxID=651086 RepID=A0A939DGE8_9GAMM|nr:RNA polymerase sigma factor [Parahaliea mediterranea]MBN7797635.1 RNA polymerase sigma factor [Parahaliea mediterranea]
MSPGRSAVSQAYLQHRNILRKFLARFLPDPRDVEDVSQEAYLRAYESERGQAVRSPKAFLFRVARNVALNELSRKARALTDYIEDAAGDSEPRGAHTLEETVHSEQRLALFCRAASRLPPQCRRAFLMRKVYGYSHREIAESLGVSTSTVEKHVATGLYRCAQFMAAMDGEIGDRAGDVRQLKGGSGHG